MYQQIRNRLVDECRKAKRRHLEAQLDGSKRDPKRMWRTLKELLKGNSYKDNTYTEIHYGDVRISEVHKMAEVFNRYFVDSLATTKEDEYGIESTVSKLTEGEFEVFQSIDVNGLNRIVHNLENKSGTEEEITTDIMKRVVAAAGPKMCLVLNRSLQEGIFPDNWKEAIVVPIPKIRGTRKVEQFRPINKLPTYEKTLEIIVHRQLVDYLESNKLINECQSGFRKKHSCETALQWTVSEWKKEIGQGKIVGVVFLDLRRAFELVNRKILLRKLKQLGIKGKVGSWFESYLKNRTQRVKFGGHCRALLL